MTGFHSTQPIYIQLADRINGQILRGDIKPGDKLPSVREMAIQVKVNPNTVQRTYRELEGMGTVETRRGQGTFVTEDIGILNQMGKRIKQEKISQFIQGMHAMGFSNQEIEMGLQLFLHQSKGEPIHDQA